MLAEAQPLPGHLAENVLHFGRVLRAAGMPVATDRIELALAALATAGLESKQDFHDVLAACFVDRVEHRPLFEQAFELYWRDPDLAGRMLAMLLPRVQAARPPGAAAPSENRRLAQALFPPPPGARAPAAPTAVEIDAVLTASGREQLRRADFETMSADEWRAAQRLLARIAPLFERLATRRARPAARPGRIDVRATLRAMARHGGDAGSFAWKQPRMQPAPLVVLADVSGSMSRYSRMLLHFAHALGHVDARVESFVFGTRLTRTTRALRLRDPDHAVAEVVRRVADWSGGTRITECLREFNRRWARRVLSGRATVLLITDGLEHGPGGPLAFEMERLAKSCRRLVWLNPLLRYDRFEPRAGGIQAMLPHVDRFLPVHNLESLEALAAVLAAPPAARPARRG